MSSLFASHPDYRFVLERMEQPEPARVPTPLTDEQAKAMDDMCQSLEVA